MGIRRDLPISSYTIVLWCCVNIYMYKHLDIFATLTSLFSEKYSAISLRFRFFCPVRFQ